MIRIHESESISREIYEKRDNSWDMGWSEMGYGYNFDTDERLTSTWYYWWPTDTNPSFIMSLRKAPNGEFYIDHHVNMVPCRHVVIPVGDGLAARILAEDDERMRRTVMLRAYLGSKWPEYLKKCPDWQRTEFVYDLEGVCLLSYCEKFQNAIDAFLEGAGDRGVPLLGRYDWGEYGFEMSKSYEWHPQFGNKYYDVLEACELHDMQLLGIKNAKKMDMEQYQALCNALNRDFVKFMNDISYRDE